VTFNNVQVLAKAAKIFKIPTVISTVAASSFSGPFMPEVTGLFPEISGIDRTSMNSSLDANFREALRATARTQIMIAGLWTEACVMFPTPDMLKEGFAIYVAAPVPGRHSISDDPRGATRVGIWAPTAESDHPKCGANRQYPRRLSINSAAQAVE